VENLAFDVQGFLNEPGRPAQVAAVTPNSTPLLGSFWFLFKCERFWFSSAKSSPLVRAASRGSQVAVIVDDFSPPSSIRQVRVRGEARVDEHDPEVSRHIYERYLGMDFDSWPPFFRDRISLMDGWALWSVAPAVGIAVTSPGYMESV
jgi:hypothetical protein